MKNEYKIPKVFISHAKEDKERFVLDFATKLRLSGIDAWVDVWELKLGDSIVDAIFEGGMKEADIVIIILSEISITKPWVRGEINVSFVNKVSGNKRLMPVLIDDCDVPECLKATLWIKIKDLNNYENEFERIKLNILGKTNKPELGELPKYAQIPIAIINGLSEIDSLMFKTACEFSIKSGRREVNSSKLLKNLENSDINEEIFYDSLIVLCEECFIEECKKNNLGKIDLFEISSFGFKTYANEFIDNYEDTYKIVIAQIINLKNKSSSIISKNTNVPSIVIVYIIKDLQREGLIEAIGMNDGSLVITEYSPRLKRLLE